MESMVSARDIDAFARGVLSPYALPFQATKLIAQRVAFDDFYFHGIDPDTGLPACSVARLRLPESFVARFAEQKLSEFSHLMDGAYTGVTVLRSADAGDEFDSSAGSLKILRPLGLKHEARVVLRDHGTVWGVLALFRAAEEPDFEPEEADLLQQMATPLARAIRRTHLWSPAESGPLEDGPAVLVLSADLRLDSCTEAAEKLLPELRGEGMVDPEYLPCPVRAVAMVVSRQSVAKGPVSSRTRTRGGQWVTLRGAWLEPGRSIVIVLDHTARADLVPLILAAHGLTARECKVAEHVLLGLSSQDVSETLGISPYTVQDHLKAVFDKTGVSSRKELAARLFAFGVEA